LAHLNQVDAALELFGNKKQLGRMGERKEQHRVCDGSKSGRGPPIARPPFAGSFLSCC
jgi:hypothetical protein